MKAPQHRCKPTDARVMTKLGCNKMQSLKPGKHTQKSSGNVGVKSRTGAGSPSGQSYTEGQLALKSYSFMESTFIDSKNLSSQLPNHSGKINLQLFPMDVVIQKVQQQEKHNPYLELILAPRKKISSVVQHLNSKWGNTHGAKGELMLFPFDVRLDSIVGSEKWTMNDSCKVADVYVAVGSPLTFRLRYGWFGPTFGQQSNEVSLASLHSAGKTISDKPSEPLSNEQKKMVDLNDFPNKFATASVECDTVQTLDNQNKVAPLSWIDCISNMSFGALLSEAAISQDSKQPPLQNASNLQQIPVTCDSFDAAIASLIAKQQASNQPKVANQSLWEAEDTCHAFPLPNQTLNRPSNSALGNSAADTSCTLGMIPENGDQHCYTEVKKEEPSVQISVLGNECNVKPDISMPGSIGEPQLGASYSTLLSGTDSLGLSVLLANSLDAFQNFSVS